MSRKRMYRRRDSFVAVKHIRLSTDNVLEPGDSISSLRSFHTLSLWKRGLIGAKDDPWTQEALEAYVAKEEKSEKPPTREVVEEVPTEPEEQPSAEEDHEELLDEEPTDEEEDSDGIEVKQLGGGWYALILNGEEVDRVQGKAKLEKWMEENGYGAEDE